MTSHPAPSAPTFLRGATVFDGERFRDDLAGVLVEAGRLRVIPHAAADTVPGGAEIVDLTGSTLSPGLIDTHVHMTISTGNSLGGFAEPFSAQFYLE